jgi:hypothetical protein
LHHHHGAGTRRKEHVVDRDRLQQQIAVALDHPDPVALELHVEESIGAEIAELPDLILAGAGADRRVGKPVQ